ncbi:UPF0722 protein C11orf88-like [Scleropages formosus]|uniref:Cilia- and flagella-associated protein HOATZ n=1 Tax=Scleropages formosus TaxID=113540 RepID=A0A0P7UHW5_SCLFO|nr:UPF0722 protein C11orf88-like [Scleropages formosus]
MANMSEQQGEHAFADLDKYYTVFAGSSPEDVAYAKLVDVQPLTGVSSIIYEGVEVPGYEGLRVLCFQGAGDEKLQEVYIKQRLEEKQRYLEMAKKRDDTLALLKKQREERIKRFLGPFTEVGGVEGDDIFTIQAKPIPTFRSLPEEAHRDIKDVQDLK